MDPEANLREQRKLAAEIVSAPDPVDEAGYIELDERANRLADLVQALDEWLTKGGFLPADWRKGRDVSDEPTKG